MCYSLGKSSVLFLVVFHKLDSKWTYVVALGYVCLKGMYIFFFSVVYLNLFSLFLIVYLLLFLLFWAAPSRVTAPSVSLSFASPHCYPDHLHVVFHNIRRSFWVCFYVPLAWQLHLQHSWSVISALCPQYMSKQSYHLLMIHYINSA